LNQLVWIKEGGEQIEVSVDLKLKSKAQKNVGWMCPHPNLSNKFKNSWAILHAAICSTWHKFK